MYFQFLIFAQTFSKACSRFNHAVGYRPITLLSIGSYFVRFACSKLSHDWFLLMFLTKSYAYRHYYNKSVEVVLNNHIMPPSCRSLTTRRISRVSWNQWIIFPDLGPSQLYWIMFFVRLVPIDINLAFDSRFRIFRQFIFG